MIHEVINMKDNRKQLMFRVTAEQRKMIEELALLSNQSINDVLIGLVVGEYDKIKGNPAVLELMEQMRNISEQMKAYSKGVTLPK